MTIPGPMKNIEKAEVLTLKEQIAYQEGQVVSKTLAQNRAVSVTLFSFDKDQFPYLKPSLFEKFLPLLLTFLFLISKILILYKPQHLL